MQRQRGSSRSLWNHCFSSCTDFHLILQLSIFTIFLLLSSDENCGAQAFLVPPVYYHHISRKNDKNLDIRARKQPSDDERDKLLSTKQKEISETNLGIFSEASNTNITEIATDYTATSNDNDATSSTHSKNRTKTDDALPLVSVLSDLTSLSSQVSYFYLRDEIGLSEDAMWKITTEASSALGMTAATIRNKINVLRSTMDLTDDDIRAILERHPSILHLSAEKNIAPKIFFLVRALDLSKANLRQLVLAQPAILSYARSNLQQKLKFFTTNLLGYSVEECRKLILSEPKLLTASVKGGLLPRARFLLKELEIPREKLRTILKKNPRILLSSLDENLIPKLIHYFIMTLHMNPPSDIIKLLTSYPQILDYNLERHILPIHQFLVTEVDFSVHEMRNILLKSPRLMTLSLAKIKHVVGYLRYELGLDAAGVRRVLYQAPQVLGLDTERNLAVKIAFFQESFGFTDLQQVQQLILGIPSVLNLSIEKNLKPKIEYLEYMIRMSEGSNCSDEEQKRILRETVIRMPALLGYSLDKRIRPRLERLVSAGLSASIITVGIPMKEDNFHKWLHGRQKKKAQRAIVLSPPPSEQPEQIRDQALRNGRIVHWTRERNSSSKT